MAHFDARWQRLETLQAIFNQISDAIFFYDENLHLVRVNNSAEQLFGLPGEKMLGKPCWELFRWATSESHPDIHPSGGPSWRLPTGTVRLRMDDGRERRVIIRTMELLDATGALEGVVATVTDITDGVEQAGPELMAEFPAHASGRTGNSILDRAAPAVERAAAAPGRAAQESRAAQEKHRRLVQRNRLIALVAGAFFLVVFLGFLASKLLAPGPQLTAEEKQRKAKNEAAARFNAMTPAQHIENAQLALRPGATTDAIQEGLRHLNVIPPSAPESNHANALRKDLTRAASLTRAQSLIDASSNADVREGMAKLQRATAIIQDVAQQYPGNQDAARLSRAAQTAVEQLAIGFPQEFAATETKLVDFNWEKGGFGTVMMASFTVRNDSPVDVSSLKIRCDHYAANGVVLDQNSATAYGVVRSRSTTRIANVNMGFLNPESGNVRTAKTNCEIVSLKLASDSPAFGDIR